MFAFPHAEVWYRVTQEHSILEETMKKVLTAIFVASFAAGIAAQSANPPQSPAQGSSQQPSTAAPSSSGSQQPTSAAPASAAGKVTVTGCLQSAPASGAAAAATSDPKFVLADARMSSAGSSSGAVGTSGTAATRYHLSGDEKTISPHLNHQVEITGTVQGAGASATAGSSAAGSSAPGSSAAGSRAPGSSTAGATSTAGGASASATAGPMLRVESVKMIAATCPQ
jgi:hypothetical protein